MKVKQPTKSDVLKKVQELDVAFIRLQFTDIFGMIKNVAIPVDQLEKALDGEIMFDGSSIEGFVRIEESDMYLRPDLSTFQIFPWKPKDMATARLICDVYNPDGTPFAGCPRSNLKRVIEEAKKLGFTMNVGPEMEFFMFLKTPEGAPTTITHDKGSYFDLAPLDKGEEARREIVLALKAMGFEVEASHHEVASGQHEIDFKYGDALSIADKIVTIRFVIKTIANNMGLHATFMPKPVYGICGSGMHVHQSLFKNGKNAFYDPDGEYQLSDTAMHYMGGLLKHSRGFTAITNPLVNSYKRLVPDFEAPVYIAWSERNRSPLVRVPARRGTGTRLEYRSPDPTCNPYLAISVMLKAGLDGIKNKTDPGKPIYKNIYQLSPEERKKMGIESLPGTLIEAIHELEKDEAVKAGLTEHIYNYYVRAKKIEWDEYRTRVHQWELDEYLNRY